MTSAPSIARRSSRWTRSRSARRAPRSSAPTHDQGGRVVTTIEPLGEWYPAEDYHQDYWAGEGQRNPYCLAVIPPKLQKLRKSFQARAEERERDRLCGGAAQAVVDRGAKPFPGTGATAIRGLADASAW